jgi:hypothetical protein
VTEANQQGHWKKDDLYVQLFKAHPDFCNSMTPTIIGNRKEGDIVDAWAHERGHKAGHWLQIDKAAEVNHLLFDLVGLPQV